MAQNAQVEAENNLDTTPVAEQEQVEEVGQTEEASERSTAETTGESNKGYQARVKELNQRAKAAEEEAQSLKARIAELTNPVGFQGPQVPQFSPQEPIVAEGEEISVAELNRRVAARDQRILQTADARSELRQRQSDAINRIQRETNEVMALYPELNPDSDIFDQDLSDSISDATEAYIKTNPYSASVKSFVAKQMKPYKGAISKEVGKATENIAKQVSQAALRPTSVRKGEKAAGEKSIAELEAELGVVNS